MKLKPINRGAFYAFLIFLFLVGITSFNAYHDWATALIQGVVAGLVSAFIYSVGYSNGVEEGKGKGYDKAMEDLKPLLPSEFSKK